MLHSIGVRLRVVPRHVNHCRVKLSAWFRIDQPTGNGRAAITGDFVLLAEEVNPVLKALRDNGIQVTALHSHMLNEQPRLFFMHFWANEDAVKLAHGLRAALDQMKSAR